MRDQIKTIEGSLGGLDPVKHQELILQWIQMNASRFRDDWEMKHRD